MRTERGLFFTRNTKKYDYINMRLITDELYARLVKLLAQDEKVAVFQQLILSKKAEPGDAPDEIIVQEGKDNGVQQSDT